MKTIDEARYDVIEQIGTYAGCAAMHDEPGKDAVSRGITAALDQLEQAIRHDETAKLLALTGSDNSDDDLSYINPDANCGANEPWWPNQPSHEDPWEWAFTLNPRVGNA